VKPGNRINRRVSIPGLASLIWLSGITAVYGIEILVIPMNYYEKQENSFVMKEPETDITGKIIDRLEKYYEIRRDRTELNDRLAGATDADARRAAETYHINYVLYGRLKDDGSSLSAEVRIYNARLEKYELFYASDRSGQYDRVIRNLCENILEWYHTERDKIDALKYDIDSLKAGLKDLEREIEKKEAPKKERPPKVEVEKEFSLRLPVRIGYWSYVERRWLELVQGTVEASLGAEMFPRLQFPPLLGMRNEAALGIQIGYRFGTTANTREVQTHDIIVNPYASYRLNFYSKNWLALGTGAFYEWSKWNINAGEYGQMIDYSQSYTGLSLLVDYGYRFNKYITVNIGANIYFYFVTDTSPVIRPYLGTEITIVGGDYAK
jgi:hypothetical protein